MISSHLQKIPLPDASTLWANQDYGIRANEEFTRYDTRTTLERASDRGQTWMHGTEYSLSAATKRISSAIQGSDAPQFDDSTTIGKTGSKALFIFYHGLNGQPSLWNNHISYVETHPKIDHVAFEIPEAGNCSFDDSPFYSLLERIVDWTVRNPFMPIVLFGQSLGSRVATFFEILLRERAPNTPVHVSLTGAVLFGSKTVNAVALDKLHSCLPSYNIYEDLSYGSETSKQLLSDARAPLAEHVAPRYYAMYAPFHDHHVYSLGSALPIINPDKQASKKERHYIVFNYGHNAIPLGVCQTQIIGAVKWIKEMKNKRNEAGFINETP